MVDLFIQRLQSATEDEKKKLMQALKPLFYECINEVFLQASHARAAHGAHTHWPHPFPMPKPCAFDAWLLHNELNGEIIKAGHYLFAPGSCQAK